MKKITTINELRVAYTKGEIPVCIVKALVSVIRQCRDEDGPETAHLLTHDDVMNTLSAQAEEGETEFEWLFGGDVHLIETEEDLNQIIGLNGKSVVDSINSWDLANYTLNDITTGWFEFFLANNCGGGHAYFVPERLWTKARVEEHREATFVEMLA